MPSRHWPLSFASFSGLERSKPKQTALACWLRMCTKGQVGARLEIFFCYNFLQPAGRETSIVKNQELRTLSNEERARVVVCKRFIVRRASF